jgi:hypothetical protein
MARAQTTSTVLMVRPVDFAFNEQTAVDNEFQHKPEHDVNTKAMAEFQSAVDVLRAAGVNVIVLERSLNPTHSKTPDAVFPNNWFSTMPDGTVVMYPMYTPNRRAETQRLADAELLLVNNGFRVNRMMRFGELNENEFILEGTGSMVIDHLHRIVYAALSVRTNEHQLKDWAQTFNYKPVTFRTASSTGKEFYHTNVVMSVGEGFAIICSASIANAEERAKVLQALKETVSEVVDITLEQTEKSFCANVLQLASTKGGHVIAMSQTAYDGFTPEQRKTLSKFGTLVPLPISTIEHVGGGSARCMLAEVFLPWDSRRTN